MLTPAVRYSLRMFVSALVGTALTLCLVSAYRVMHVHRSLTNAARYHAVDRPELVVRELRLAYAWSSAYTGLREPVQRLAASAAARTGRACPVPVPRSFSAPLPLAEKILIPADLLVGGLFRLVGPTPVVVPPMPVDSPVVEPSPRERPESRPGATRQDVAASVTVSRPASEAPPERRPPPPVRESVARQPPRAAAPAPALPSPPADDAPADFVLLSTSPSAPSRPQTPEPPASGDRTPARPADNSEGMWGAVTRHNAPIFNQTGSRIRTVPAGSLVDVQRIQPVSSGEIIHGAVWSRVGTFQNVILRRDDVEVYLDGTLASTTRQQRELVSKRAELLAAIEVRNQEMEEAIANLNPYQQDYRNVLIQYRAIDNEAEKLKSEFDQASGSRRMELANRLRILKNDQMLLMPRYQDLKQKKETWDERNRHRRPALDPDNDPAMQQLRKQLMEVNEQLYSL